MDLKKNVLGSLIQRVSAARGGGATPLARRVGGVGGAPGAALLVVDVDEHHVLAGVHNGETLRATHKRAVGRVVCQTMLCG